ncbi:MAG: M24 family metallopeptidase [Parasphingopyxis sp.]|uniref:M24 family metallopeptidase n=1 Tax=Parasphingopyxis sp. TaxID=1920299 RepID=UPI003FA16537
MVAIAALLTGPITAPAALAQERADPPPPAILPLEQRAAIEDRWLRERLDTVIPMLLRRDDIDMWIVIGREYHEDPVLESMLPATWLSARRRTVLIFHDRGEELGVERMAVARYPVADIFPAAWDPEQQPDQWARIAELVRDRDPARIAVNISSDFALADGLTVSQHRELRGALGPLSDRLVSSDRLALGWLETRIPAEMATYPQIVRLAHAIIAEGLSERAITPGVTTAGDLRWWFRERVAALGLDTWFHPSVNIQRAGESTFAIASMGLGNETVIEPGDFLHLDFGISYLGLNTDTQHHAYVLRPGETEAPRGLREGLAVANRVQDLLTREFRTGRKGNEVLAAARAAVEREGLDATIYSHAIGTHGHGAGPWIGMWDNQEPVPGRGDYGIYPHTAWSIELNARAAVPEWGGQVVRFMTEEDGYFDGHMFRYLDGRQTEIHLIPRQ